MERRAGDSRNQAALRDGVGEGNARKVRRVWVENAETNHMWGRHQRPEAWREGSWDVRHHWCIHSQVKEVNRIGYLEQSSDCGGGGQSDAIVGLLLRAARQPGRACRRFIYRRVAPPNHTMVPRTRPSNHLHLGTFDYLGPLAPVAQLSGHFALLCHVI